MGYSFFGQAVERQLMWAFVMIAAPPLCCLAYPYSCLGQSKGLDFDAICGPRSVQYVLRQQGGESPNLSELVIEVQGGSVTSGCTFSDLERVLDNHGIHSKLVRLRWPNVIQWGDGLAIVHVDGNHFAVLTDSALQGPTLWWGLEGEKRVSWRDFSNRVSSSVLLTSDKPLGSKLKTRPWWWLFAGDSTLLLGPIVALSVAIFHYTKRAKHHMSRSRIRPDY